MTVCTFSHNADGNDKVSMMLMMNCVTFTVLTLPEMVSTAFLVAGYTENLTLHQQAIAQLLDSINLSLKLANHSINFLVYCISGKVFRNELKNLIMEVFCLVCRIRNDMTP